MKKYTLNETPVKTTNGFKINNINVEFDIPTVDKFNIFNITTNEIKNLDINIDKPKNEELNSKIGLKNKLDYKISIKLDDYTELKDDVIIEYHLTDEEPKLTSLIDIKAGNNTKAHFIIKFISEEKKYNFNYLKQITTVGDNSNITVSILPVLNEESISLVAIENKVGENSKLIHNYYDLKGSKRISNYYTDLLFASSTNELNNIYLGKKDNLIDMNYLTNLVGRKTNAKMNTVGAIKDTCKKFYKSTVDFKEGSSKSNGVESENCIILSDEAQSRSLPMLLCHEEDVAGSHSVSSGKINEKKLFYLMSRGLSKKESLKLIVNASFNEIVEEQKNKELKECVLNIINKEL